MSLKDRMNDFDFKVVRTHDDDEDIRDMLNDNDVNINRDQIEDFVKRMRREAEDEYPSKGFDYFMNKITGQ